MIIVLPDARSLPDVVLRQLRWLACSARQKGYDYATIADILHLSREVVSRWFAAFQQGGPEALPDERTGRPLGTGRALSPEQELRIQELLRKHLPEELDIALPLWSRRAVRELIFQQFQIQLSHRAVGNYLKRWNFTGKRPARQSQGQVPQEVQAWLEETYPAIEDRAVQEDAEIHFADETGIDSQSNYQRGYAPRGKRAKRSVTKRRHRLNVFAMMNNQGRFFYRTYTETMNTERFLSYLQERLSTMKKKLFLIADRLKAHTSEAAQSWLQEHREQIEMFELPRYAPERNVMEYFNGDVKREVSRESLPKTQAEHVSRVRQVLDRLASLPGRLKNYFLQKDVAYAAALA